MDQELQNAEKRVVGTKPVTMVDTMQELGKLCAVGVKTAAAAVLK